MLLNRRRIRRWARWIALFLAIVFAASFIFLGVGYGSGNFNFLSAFSCSGSKTATTLSDSQKLDGYLATLAKNPKDTQAMLAIATFYQQNNDYANAAKYLEEVIATDPTQTAVYLRLADLYLGDTLQQYSAAVTVLNKAVTVDPNNAQVYLKLGSALNLAGKSSAAILAWEKYIQLDPNGDQVSTVQAKIKSLSATTTTAATTTTGAATATTGATTTTTAK